jgi:hypothetical protein
MGFWAACQSLDVPAGIHGEHGLFIAMSNMQFAI